MEEYKIPKSFNLMGSTIKVSRQKTLMNRHGCLGLSIFAENKILIQSCDDNFGEEAAYLTFLHEAMHFKFWVLQEHDLCANEKLVDMLANLELQIVKSSKY